jgi:hypothetical protein
MAGIDALLHRHESAIDVGAVRAPMIRRSQITQTITTIGLNIAKSVFQVHGVDNRPRKAASFLTARM